MAVCEDPALTHLRGLGYNVVRQPRSDIVPLDVLARTKGGNVEALGPLETVWRTTQPKPTPTKATAGAVRVRNTNSFHGVFGIKILGDLLSGLGLKNLGGKFGLTKAKAMRFHFGNPTVSSIKPLPLGAYLSRGDVDNTNVAVTRYFYDEDTEIFLITEVVQSAKITIEFLSDNKSDAEADASALEGVLDVEAKVSRESNRAAAITVDSDVPLTFGFKASAVVYAKGMWSIEGAVPAGDIFLGVKSRKGTTKVKPVLLSPAGRLQLGIGPR